MNEDSYSLVAEINGCISTAAKRQNGLLKLISFLENCSSNQECSFLEQNCSFWIKTLFQIFENHPVSLHAKLAHYCFYLIIQNSKNISSDLSRHISTSYIEKSISLLTSSNDILSKNALICLNELMSCYRASCSQYKQKIENYVMNKLESDSEEVLNWASICYAKLPYLHKNINDTDMWYVYFKNMLKNANILLNDLFEDYQQNVIVASNETQMNMEENLNQDQLAQTSGSNISFTTKSDSKLFTKLNKDTENLEFYFKKSLKRFKACCLCLGYLFEPLNERVVIKIRSQEIITFLKRIFLFDFKKLLNNCRMNMESKYLNGIISEMINSALEFAQKFFNILNTNLLPQSSSINSTLANFGYSLFENNYSNSISAYYDCLSIWLNSTGYNSGFQKVSSSVLDNLLNVIKPVEKNILSIENNKNDQSKFKNKPKLGIDNSNEKFGLNNYQQECRSKIIISALKCLNDFIKFFSFNLPYNQFDKIQQTIIDIILCVQYNSNLRKPYDQTETRLKLYEVLFELCLTKHNKIAPPISISIGLFKNALNDYSKEIKYYAKSSLNCLQTLTYPIQPTYKKEYTIEVNNVIPNKQTSKEGEHLTNGLTENQASTSTSILSFNSINQSSSNHINSKVNSVNQEQKLSTFSSLTQNTNDKNKQIVLNGFSESTNNNSNQNNAKTQDSLEDMKNSLNLKTNNQNSVKRKIDQDEDDYSYMNKVSSKKFQNENNVPNKNTPMPNKYSKPNKNGRIGENSNGDEQDDEDIVDLIEDEEDVEEEFEEEAEEDEEDEEEEVEEEEEDIEEDAEEEEIEEEEEDEVDEVDEVEEVDDEEEEEDQVEETDKEEEMVQQVQNENVENVEMVEMVEQKDEMNEINNVNNIDKNENQNEEKEQEMKEGQGLLLPTKSFSPLEEEKVSENSDDTNNLKSQETEANFELSTQDIKNIIKESGGDYEDDEETETETVNSQKQNNSYNNTCENVENDDVKNKQLELESQLSFSQMSTVMNLLDNKELESQSLVETESTNTEDTKNQDQQPIQTTQENESNKESENSADKEEINGTENESNSEGPSNDAFDDAKFKEMCATFKVDALAENQSKTTD